MIIYKEQNYTNILNSYIFGGCESGSDWCELCRCCNIDCSWGGGMFNFSTGTSQVSKVCLGLSCPNSSVYWSSKMYQQEAGGLKLNCPLFVKSNMAFARYDVSFGSNQGVCHRHAIYFYDCQGCVNYLLCSSTEDFSWSLRTSYYIYDCLNCCMTICNSYDDGTSDSSTVSLTGWNIYTISLRIRSWGLCNGGTSYHSGNIYRIGNIANNYITEYNLLKFRKI